MSDTCNICKCDRKYYTGVKSNSAEVVICANCSTMRTYGGVPKYASDYIPYKIGPQMLENFCLIPRKGPVLDVGCATGNLLKALDKVCDNVYGVEFVPEAYEIAKNRGFNVKCGDVTEYKDENFFKIVFMYMTLEHTDSPMDTLKHIHKILDKNGLLELSVPNAGCWEFRYFGKYWDALDLPKHRYHFTEYTVTEALKRAGFYVETVIHQINATNIIGSVFAKYGFKRQKMGWWLTKILLPIAVLMAAIRQSGRITVIARKGGK